ncbi:Nitrate transporter 1.3 [Hordeum vulgare]|nr:Nitrate transporter 1.3 [Hordeum vulgare]
MSDSTICENECNYLEGGSEPQPNTESEVVDRPCEAISINSNLTSTSIVSSPLVLGPIYDDAPILDYFDPPLDKTMAMVEYDAPPTWFQHDEDDHDLVFDTSPTPHEWNKKGNIGEGDALVPLVDIDCLHDDDPPIDMLHDYATSTCDELPIYDEFDDSHVESTSCDDMLHRISFENSIGHFDYMSTSTTHDLTIRALESEPCYTDTFLHCTCLRIGIVTDTQGHTFEELLDGETLESAPLELDDDECLVIVHFDTATPSPSHGDLDFDTRTDLSQGGMIRSILRTSPWQETICQVTRAT